MNETYELSLSLHRFFAQILVVLTIIYFVLVILKFNANDKLQTLKYIRRIRLFLPIYYAFFVAILTTGAFNFAVLNFSLNFRIFAMCVGLILMIIFSAKAYKALKSAYFNQNFKTYRLKMAKFLGLNLAIILFVSFV